MKKVVDFLRQHPIVANIIYIFIAIMIVSTGAMYFLDFWTHHGDVSTVPSVKGLEYTEAVTELRKGGFTVEISDSVFESSYPAGTVVEQSPRQGANVKNGRTVYLTIVAFTPRMVSVPQFMNTSLRQGRAMFEGAGIKDIRIVEVASEYKDLVLGAKFNGMPLKAGTRIPVTATVTLEVGRGYVDEPSDSTDTDIDDEYAD